ncbi:MULTISPECIES: ParM/StbA family protein [Acidithiobacillus]|uniref:ParM/StbA family protein n=1 Tax=Acidithiobacillus TaxID=119977 RepID=UPI0009821640|nr:MULTISPECIES: ParM/StbA family protein [Acidithiobacillus]
MEKKMQACGINIGYGYLKIKTKSGYLQVASVVEKTRKSSMGSVGAMRETLKVVVDNATYEVGADAHHLSSTQNTSKSVSDAWYDTVQYRALMQLVIDRLQAESETEGDDKWVVTIGIAVNQYMRPAIRKQLANLWRGEHLSSEGEKIEIKKVTVVPEPYGAYTYYKDKYAEKTAGRRIMVIDIGYRTTDWVEVVDSKVIERQANAINLGMFDVYSEICRNIISDHDANLDIVAVEQAILSEKETRVRGTNIDMKKYYDNALKTVGRMIESRIRTEIGAADQTDLVLVAGGGAKDLIKFVQKSFQKHNVEICENPQEANAHGYFLSAYSMVSMLS